MALKRARSAAQRAKVYAKIGRQVARTKTPDGEGRRRARRALVELLGQARGLPMKVGQHLAEGADGDDFMSLTDSATPVPLTEILPVVSERLGRPVDEVFTEFEPAVAAASLGQVHRARLRSGQLVAVKVRYPGIEDVITAELDVLLATPAVGPLKPAGIEPRLLKAAFHEGLTRELDYRREARAQERFRNTVLVSGLVVPEVFPMADHDGLLVQAWCEGLRLERAAELPQAARQSIGQTLFDTFWHSTLVVGHVHADPHRGNYLFSSQGQVTLLDFGCTLDWDPEAQKALRRWFESNGSGETIDGKALLDDLNFSPGVFSLSDAKIDQSLRFVADCMLRPRWSGELLGELKAGIKARLGADRSVFIGAMPPPLWLWIRALRGLLLQLSVLDVEVEARL